ncbi:MAG: OsmC family protein [Jatrophihabitans sp.]
MTDTHVFRSRVSWGGSTGVGYDHYDRAHRAEVLDPDGRPVVPTLDGAGLRLSADPAFRGNAGLLNTEQLLVVATSSCQLLSFLAVAARARVDVVEYIDEAVGEMPEDRLTVIRLSPVITLTGSTADERLDHLVEVAHRECYIANSLSTEVLAVPTYLHR